MLACVPLVKMPLLGDDPRARGRILVSEFGASQVRVISLDGRSMQVLPFASFQPSTMHILNRDASRLFVADFKNHRVHDVTIR